MRLNGWQRAWVFVTAIWLCIVVITAWSMFPTEDRQIEEARGLWLNYAPTAEPEENCFQYQDIKSTESCAQEKIAKAKIKQENESAARERIAKRVDEESTQVQATYVGKALAAWLLPALIFYGLGSGLAWVRKGFQKA